MIGSTDPVIFEVAMVKAQNDNKGPTVNSLYFSLVRSEVRNVGFEAGRLGDRIVTAYSVPI